MVGEWPVEEDESGGRGHVPPVQEVVQESLAPPPTPPIRETRDTTQQKRDGYFNLAKVISVAVE